jgi:hypothetical protein
MSRAAAPEIPTLTDPSDLNSHALDSFGEDWVRFAKTFSLVLTASPLAASEVERLVRHRFHQ